MARTLHVSDLSEDELIRRFFEPMTDGLDDDVARIMVSSDSELLVSTDALQEEIHFLKRCPPRLVGEKAVRSNASDIVASGGTPRWMTLSLGLPRNLEMWWLEGLVEGIKQGAADTGLALIGGDTTAAAQHISISITVMGTVPRGRSVFRCGARPGDMIGVTGYLGESIPGLEVILGRRKLKRELAESWIVRHFTPPFRGKFGRAVADHVTAMMDLSDGLAADLPRLCKASGVRAEIDLFLLPLSPEAHSIGLTREAALRGGEDYELLFTVPPSKWETMMTIAANCNTNITKIGSIHEGQGLRFLNEGNPVNPRVAGFKHFA